jgi:hypothetical protein
MGEEYKSEDGELEFSVGTSTIFEDENKDMNIVMEITNNADGEDFMVFLTKEEYRGILKAMLRFDEGL